MAKIYVTGMSGTGKSSIMRVIQERTNGIVTIDLDWLGRHPYLDKDKAVVNRAKFQVDTVAVKSLKAAGYLICLGISNNWKDISQLEFWDVRVLLDVSPEQFENRIKNKPPGHPMRDPKLIAEGVAFIPKLRQYAEDHGFVVIPADLGSQAIATRLIGMALSKTQGAVQ
jgi:shikimate kinase